MKNSYTIILLLLISFNINSLLLAQDFNFETSTIDISEEENTITAKNGSIFFPEKKIGGKEVPAIFYDLKSKYDYLWGKKLGYIYDKEEVLRQLQEFVNDYRGLSK